MSADRVFPAAVLALVLLGAGMPCVAADDPARRYDEARAALVAEVVREVRQTRDWLGIDTLDPAVMESLATVPRHEFVPEELRDAAYLNRPLPIGHGQTISQPYIVAIMTELVRPRPGQRVLEVGTGSGYQAAVLAPLVAEVYTIEIIPALGEQARERLSRLGVANVQTRIGDGYHGWPQAGPFDAIVVTAAASHVPPPLVAQLKPGGRMMIPVGSRFAPQQLLLVDKDADGVVSVRQVLPVRFVPLTGGHD